MSFLNWKPQHSGYSAVTSNYKNFIFIVAPGNQGWVATIVTPSGIKFTNCFDIGVESNENSKNVCELFAADLKKLEDEAYFAGHVDGEDKNHTRLE